MSQFTERLVRIMDEMGLKQVDLAERMLVSPSYINHLTREVRKPGRETLKKLSAVLGVTIDYLAGRDQIIPEHDIRMVPVISYVHAGAWHEASDPYAPGIAEAWVPYDVADDSAIALRVIGDSMEPEYKERDIIILSPMLEPRAGGDVVAKWDDEVTFKRLRRIDVDKVVLLALNPKYDPWVIQGQDLRNFRIVGPVIGQVRDRGMEVSAIVEGGE